MSAVITDANFPQVPSLQPLWHSDAPQLLHDDCPANDPFGNWSVWRKHLAKREEPVAPRFLKWKNPPVLWGWPESLDRVELQSMFESFKTDNSIAAVAISGIAFDEITAPPELPLALQIVALAYALPELAGELPAQKWWQIVERLHELASEAQQHRVDWPADPHDVLRQQLLAGELPLALHYLFPEVRALQELGKPARAALSEGLIELTDGEGLPHARLLGVLAPLFACWTRCRWLGERLKKGSWSRDAEHQYEWFVRNAIRLADAGGRYLLTPLDEAHGWSKESIATAIEFSGDRDDAAAAATAISRRVVPKSKDKKLRSRKLPDPSLNSDWSGVSVMASGWSQTDARLAIAYTDRSLNFELSAGGERLFFGEWNQKTTCDGAAVEVTGEWERLCWETGKRYDFLELGIELSHGLRLERQLLLGREDRVLYLADIIMTTDGSLRRLHHTFSLPLDAAATWQPEFETRDGIVAGRKMRAAVMPMALGEWRSDPRGGSLYAENGRLVLSHEAHGRAMCCPLFFDLDRKRTKQQRTWRQLTVAEWMEILPHDVAVGYRAQSGSDQWLFYRSLGPCGNRTVLGQNIAGEFTAGPFLDSGKYKEWVEIESA
jgi:hypothetical protein